MNSIKMRKPVILVVSAILCVFLILAGVLFAIWHNELSAVMSFHQLRERDDSHEDGSVYELTVKGGFYLDDFIAQGGVSSDSELIQFVTDHITKGVIHISIKDPEIGCSSFTATTVDGDALFARNYDMKKTNTCIVHTEASQGRHATISTVDLNFLGMDPEKDVTGLVEKITCLAAPYAPLDGMNDAGVSCGIYMTYQGDETVATDQNTQKPDFTSTTFLRLVLDYADNLEEAVEIAKRYDMHDSAGTSYHYMVADASGRSAVLEWVSGTDRTDNDGSARQLVVTYSDNDAALGEAEASSSYQWVTNFILQPGYYDSEKDQLGLDRYEHISQQLAQTDGILTDEQAAMDVLASVGRRTWNNDDKNHCTAHSVVYNLTDKTVTWVPNENYDDESAWFSFCF